jgi:inorganic pyrophosphatase
MRANKPVGLLERVDADGDNGLIHVVVDTPAKSSAKFKYDRDLGCFRLSRLLPAGLMFPYNFGSIPDTSADDGDALDVMLLVDTPLFVGCLVNARIVGVLEACQGNDRSIRNDRLLGVPVTEVNDPPIHDLVDIADRILADIERFFVTYNEASGRRFTPIGRAGANAAMRAVRAGQRRYSETSRRAHKGVT